VAASSGDLASEWNAIVELAKRSPLEGLYAYAECMAGLAPTPEVLANHLSFFQMDLVDPEFHKHALAHAHDTLDFLKATLDDAIRKRDLSPCDTTRLARTIQATVGGSLMQWAIDRKGTVRRRLREDLEMVLAPRHPARRGVRRRR
jgi:hypothetical protein